MIYITFNALGNGNDLIRGILQLLGIEMDSHGTPASLFGVMLGTDQPETWRPTELYNERAVKMVLEHTLGVRTISQPGNPDDVAAFQELSSIVLNKPWSVTDAPYCHLVKALVLRAKAQGHQEVMGFYVTHRFNVLVHALMQQRALRLNEAIAFAARCQHHCEKIIATFEGPILQLDYKETINNPKAAIKRITAFCGKEIRGDNDQ